MAKQEYKKKGKSDGKSDSNIPDFTKGIPADVKEIVGRAGSRGELTQVMCLVQDGRDKGKVMRRNVKGPVQVGDVLMLLETEIEAHRLGGGKRGRR